MIWCHPSHSAGNPLGHRPLHNFLRFKAHQLPERSRMLEGRLQMLRSQLILSNLKAPEIGTYRCVGFSCLHKIEPLGCWGGIFRGCKNYPIFFVGICGHDDNSFKGFLLRTGLIVSPLFGRIPFIAAAEEEPKKKNSCRHVSKKVWSWYWQDIPFRSQETYTPKKHTCHLKRDYFK